MMYANSLEFRCCVDIDLKAVNVSVEVSFILDPCYSVISVGFGNWNLNISLFAYHWNTEEILSIGNAITMG